MAETAPRRRARRSSARGEVPREMIAQVRRIEIRTRRMVQDLFQGEYHSVFRGRGMEFDEVRQYVPGDDVRSIDWNVTARHNEPFVKSYVEERELTVSFLVDLSSSTDFGLGRRTKGQTAAEIAAVLAMSAVRNKDKVGLIPFTDRIEAYDPPRKGRGHVLRLIRDILFFEPEGRGTRIDIALEFAGRVHGRGAVIFLISDFQAGGYERTLTTLARRNDVVAIHVEDDVERELRGGGLATLIDPETGERAEVDLADPGVRAMFARVRKERRARTEQTLRTAGVDAMYVAAGGDYVTPIRNFFRTREQRRR